MAATSVSCRSAAQAPPRRRKKRVSTGSQQGPWTIETGDQVPGGGFHFEPGGNTLSSNAFSSFHDAVSASAL
jgi:hypothetical protein